MWYIWMIIGLYICIPFLKPIVADRGKMLYFLLLSFLFAYAIPAAKQLAGDFAPAKILRLFNAAYTNVSRMRMDMVMGYLGCFVLGYFLNTQPLKKSHRICIYTLGCVSYVAMYLLSLAIAITKKPGVSYYSPLTPYALFMAVAAFVLFKNCKFTTNRLTPLLFKLSKYSFGAYLAHPLVITSLKRIGFDSLTVGNPVISMPCAFVVVAVIAFGISAILNTIPVVGKYIV